MGKGGYGGGYGGGFGGNQMQQMLKQAQKMQEEVQKAQTELEESEVLGESGNGMVKVYLGGNYIFKRIEISPDIVDPDDVEMLEDLIAAAFNNANAEVEKLRNEKLGKFGGMGGLL